MAQIVIVDYGLGNLRSVSKAFSFLGADIVISNQIDTIRQAQGLVLPGVGAFQAGVRGLKENNLLQTIKDFANSGKPMLGICLGAQLLLSKGFEFGVYEGLDIISGQVVHFPPLQLPAKVPHMGWNSLASKDKNWQGTILDGVGTGQDVYFVHSYILEPADNQNCLAVSSHGEYEFCAVVSKGNIYGCQFHPEKSGQVGLQIIKNFIDIVKKENK